VVKIYEFMQRKGIRNQQEFADILGLTQSTISAWNAGVRNPTYEICVELLKMGMTTDELFGVECSQKKNESDLSKQVKQIIIEALRQSM